MTASKHQPAIQAFIDRLSPVERHRVCRLLNWHAVDFRRGIYYERRPVDNPAPQYEYNIDWLHRVVLDSFVIAYAKAISTGTAGQE